MTLPPGLRLGAYEIVSAIAVKILSARTTEIMCVTVGADGRVTAPILALKGDYYRAGPDTPGFVHYDVFADGSFLLLKDEGPPIAPRIEVVVNWAARK